MVDSVAVVNELVDIAADAVVVGKVLVEEYFAVEVIVESAPKRKQSVMIRLTH